MSDYDLFVIGGGSGGVRAARIAAGHGARVAIAEEYRYGGTCVIRGCVPKKLFVFASHFAEDFEDAAAYGWTVGETSFDWSTLVANKDKEIDRLSGIYINLLTGAGVSVFDGRAVMNDAHTVAIGDQLCTAERILVATGGHPVVPAIPGIEHAITSNEAFHLDTLPEHITVVGGGYIALEFACIFHGLGREVTLLYRREQILRGFDDDVRDHVAREIVKKGIDLRTQTNVEAIAAAGERFHATLTDGSTLETGLVMFATGRDPNTSGMGLGDIGVGLDGKGAVVVDEWSRSSVAHIYAVGDVTDRIALTPVALMEGHAFADSTFGNLPRKPDHDNVPYAVFSQPSISCVGLSEAEARARHGDIELYKSSFRPLRHTLSGRDEQIFMKLIVEAESDRILGCHVVGPEAAEMIQGIAVAIKCGATKAQFDATVGIHPTSAEELVTMRDKWLPPEAQAAQ